MRHRIWSSCVAAGALLSGAAAKDRLPIIDMHMHASDPAEFGGPQAVCANRETVEFPPIDPREEMTVQKAMACARPLMSARDHADNISRTAAIMTRYNIYGVLDASRIDLESSLLHYAKWASEAPERYMLAVDFGDIEPPNLAALERAVVEGRIRVFAEVSPQYDGALPTTERLDAYFALAERLDVPVGVHLGEGPPGGAHVMPGSKYAARAGRPLDLEPLLNKYPKLRVYVMHYGSPLVEEMLALLYAHPQLYVDVAQNNWGFPRAHFYDQLKRIVDAGFSKRILFGSDQMIWPDTIDVAIETIEEAPFLSREQKRDIFYNNAARFLRLSDEEISHHHGE